MKYRFAPCMLGVSLWAAGAHGAEPAADGLQLWLGLPLFTELAGSQAGGVGLLGLLVVAYYYLLAWLAVGSKRGFGKVTARPTPPTDIPPAALRYVFRMGYDDRTFATALLSMASKGFLYIEEKDRTLSVVRDEGAASALSTDEAKLGRRLFDNRSKLALSWSNRTLLAELKKYVRYQLDHRYRHGYFRRNLGWCLAGLVLSTAVMVAMFLTHFIEAPGSEAVRRLLDFGVGLGLAVLAPLFILREFRKASTGFLTRLPITLALLAAVCALLGAAMVYDAGYALYTANFFPALLILAGLTCVNAVFLPRLPNYTRQGRAIMREAVGFKRYLRERREAFFPTDDAERIFEVFLPYAVALDEGEAWGALLMDTLGDAPKADRDGPGYAPVWYSGNKWSRLSPPEFVVSLTGAITAAVSSTAAPASPESGAYKPVKRPGASPEDMRPRKRDRMR